MLDEIKTGSQLFSGCGCCLGGLLGCLSHILLVGKRSWRFVNGKGDRCISLNWKAVVSCDGNAVSSLL